MRTLFTIFIFSLLTFSSKAQWVELNTGLENPPYFNDVYAITPDIVVVTGPNGTILKTTDGGETWVQKSSGTTVNLGKLQFPTSHIGYIIGADGKLLKTTDSGETWTTIDLGETVILNSLSCVNENLIFISTIITGSGNRLLKSEDGGETWENLNELPFISDIQFVSPEIGFARNFLNLTLSKTENGGGTWQELTGEIAPIHFLDENIGFCYLDGLRKTIDGGNNFVELGIGGWWSLTDIFAINENVIWGILPGTLDGDPSSRGIIKITYSDTEPYTEIIAPENNPETDMLSIYFADETTGYVVGYKYGKGAIWKNGTGINEFPMVNTTDVNSEDLFKIYPNPASKEINIEFNKLVTDNIKVLFTDLTGKKMYEKSFSNTNKLNINIEQFPKGAYILSVKTNNKLYNKKIIIN